VPEYAVPVAYGSLSFSDINTEQQIFNFDEEVISVHYYDTLMPINLTELVNLGDTVLEASYSTDLPFGPFPVENGQSIFSLEEEFSFNLDGAELRSGAVRSGFLKVIFESDADGYLDLNYSIPGITLEGEPLALLGQTSPASEETPFIDELLLDISGYTLDFTGESGLERNRLTGELSVLTSAEPLYTAQIYGDDVVSVKLELIDLEVEELRGYFGQWFREIDEEIVLDSTLYQGGTISLAEMNAQLEFINNFGVDAQIELQEVSSINSLSLEQVPLSVNGLTDLLNIPRAIETVDEVLASSVSFNFDNTSNITEAIAVTPNRFRILGDALLNPLGDVTGGFDFYRADYPFQIVADISFPLCLGIENFILRDSIDIDFSALENVKSASLNLVLNNEFQVGFDLSMQLPQSSSAFWSGSIIPAAENSSESMVLEITLDQDLISELIQAEQVVLTATANSFLGQEVKILTDQNLEITITAKAELDVEI